MVKEEHEGNRGPTRGYGMSEDNRTTRGSTAPSTMAMKSDLSSHSEVLPRLRDKDVQKPNNSF